jgi:penicillin amidase
MKLLRRIFFGLLLLVMLLVVGGGVFFWDLTRGMLPQHSGELRLSGLTDRVEILRDPEGIPHIYASSLHDLYFAQGYTQAQDRWWQMEFFRHTGSGTLQELTGKTDSLMGTDIFIRQIGWRRAAERELAALDEEVIAILESFAAGVNAYISNRAPGDLAMEYGVLGLTGVNISIEPWTPVDTLVWAKVMQWDLSGDADGEEFRQSVIDAVGLDLWADYAQPFPYGEHPTIVQPEDLALPADASARLPSPALANAPVTPAPLVAAGNLSLDTGFILGKGSGIGSNNWVVGGDLTASGRPLLANDPHLGVQMPSIWYEVGLHCAPVTDACPMDVVGFALSPTPGVIIGHNGRIAWGVTNVGPDTQDLYRIQVNPANELQYRWNDEWRDFIIHEEVINFGDGEPALTLRVRETHLGPVINDNPIDEETGNVLGFNNEDPVVMRWTALEGGTLFRAVIGINGAQNWDEFREALRYWDSPSQNFVYADVEGNIGYQTPGMIPIRAEGENGNLPTDCAEDACGWQGFIPYESLPTIYNPERGYIATANQAVVPLEFYAALAQAEGGDAEQYVLGRDWDIGYRGARIVEMLEASSAHTLESFAAIHADNKLLFAETFAPFLTDLSIEDTDIAEMRQWMLEWDYQLDRESGRAAFWMIFIEHLTEAAFNDQLALGEQSAAGSPDELYALSVLVNEADNGWWDDVGTADLMESRDTILLRALTEATAAARQELGEDRESWQWGALHTTTFVSNPLGLSGIDLIEGMVNRGPIATNGGRPAVNATTWNFRSDTPFAVNSAPSMRMIVDVGAFDNSLTINPTGQSGHPFSPQYDSMIERWRDVEYHPMLWTREQVEGAAAATLVLLPGD